MGKGRWAPRVGAAALACIAVGLSMPGCSPTRPSRPAEAGYDYDLPFKELMEHVVQPAAFGVWHAAGVRFTKGGEEDLGPKTEAGWLEVENSAATVSETGNLLLLPGRIRSPETAWRGYVNRLVLAGKKAKIAAEAKDEDKVFAAGTELEAACSACHAQFMPGGEGGPPPLNIP